MECINRLGCTENRAEETVTQGSRGSLDLRVTLGERHRGGVRHLSINSGHNITDQHVQPSITGTTSTTDA